MTAAPAASVATLARRLDHLFQTVHPASRGALSVHEVAAAVVERGGPSIDPGYIDQLRRGEAGYPPDKVLELLAAVFGVPAGYFADDAMAEHIDAELAVLTAMRDGRARVRVCPRVGSGEFSASELRAIAECIHQAIAMTE
jgi:transcriptional regulator with XRE-family HTH domain